MFKVILMHFLGIEVRDVSGSSRLLRYLFL